MTDEPITTDLLIAAYTKGYFPMAESRDATELLWFHPEHRGIIPLDTFHVPTSLAKFLRKSPFSITTDTVFDEVIRGCADTNRKGSWINDTIISLYCELHGRGFAHSVECWKDGELVGGLYGVAIGGAFCGESMFSRTTNASKAALVHLVNLLNTAGYSLLDTQFINDHLQQFGVIEIPREEYLQRLEVALDITPFPCWNTIKRDQHP